LKQPMNARQAKALHFETPLMANHEVFSCFRISTKCSW
jgi:hypothetical protein